MSNVIEPPSSCNVFTPPALAAAIVRVLADDQVAKWLEPCVGKGAFLTALARHGVAARHVVGIDLCGTSEPTDSFATVERGTEFLNWAIETPKRIDRVVANPPYIALSKLPPPIQDAGQRTKAPDGTPVGKGANCWYAFLCASLSLLKKGGGIGFVLPAAFEYANYARSLRASLPALFAQVDVHRCRSTFFDAVEDGSVVLIGRGFGFRPKSFQRYEYATLHELVAGLGAKRAAGSRIAVGKSPSKDERCVRLNDIMSIGLGAVTGDASYFLMTEEERRRWKLPVSAFRRVLSKAKHLNKPLIAKKCWMQLRSDGERVWLFRPTGKALSHPAVKRYLRLSLKDGGCRRAAYKVANREPWYVTPLPKTPDGFISGMSQYGPILCLNGMPELIATNTLYTVQFCNKVSVNARYAWALMLLTSSVRQQLNAIIRKYALGLGKLEPCDLNSLSIPIPRLDVRAASDYRRAFEALLAGNETSAMRIADSHVYTTARRLGPLARTTK
jgi:adenine-specific DNA-methyltransferase